jgi:type IX secretion system PorP/SprF family membrane protein
VERYTKKPKQFYINAHLPVYLFNGAAGFELYSDKLGLINTTGVNFSYNYVQVIPGGLISGGVRLGLEQNALDGTAIITPEGVYLPGSINHNDPLLPNTKESGLSPYWELGGFISHNYYDIGLTISNFFPGTAGIANLDLKSQAVASLFVQLPVYLGDYELLPSVLLKTDLDIFQTDISCLVKNGNIFGGLSLRGYNENSFDALVIIGGIKLNQHYTLTYSYDAGLNDIKNISQGSHEININYNLNKRIAIGLPPEIIYNPRNL